MQPVRAAVVALQGSVEPHLHALHTAGCDPIEVRTPDQLDGVTHLVMPGGESTTLSHLLEIHGLSTAIRERVQNDELALLGTCAGAILMGRDEGQDPRRWSLIDVSVQRNAYGRQIHSFVDSVHWSSGPAPGETEGVFIRAPRLEQLGPEVEILAICDQEPVAVKQNRCVACTFHPELTTDPRVHRWFLGL
ncbi:MAG: pyridoxal 5'-phosphate synthase glutaminase subunit PdxT [Planctomycetota bacterium]|nr:pyridoxal 5'-phosphate synthase glutaminase subunit PdxT [Planctomycetota bacterium]NRA75023.1 pyridoxal 5'-phosphate synthase glutaminase subunit PdxT [Planctomycetota bacterium]